MRSFSRKYDLAEHDYPQELDMFSSVLAGMEGSSEEPCRWSFCDKSELLPGEGAKRQQYVTDRKILMEMCYGDAGYL